MFSFLATMCKYVTGVVVDGHFGTKALQDLDISLMLNGSETSARHVCSLS